MIRGIDTFKKYFSGYEDQYVLIGGAACDILFSNSDVLRIAVEMILDDLHGITGMVRDDFNQFLQVVAEEPFDRNVLKRYGVKSEEVRQRLERLMQE